MSVCILQMMHRFPTLVHLMLFLRISCIKINSDSKYSFKDLLDCNAISEMIRRKAFDETSLQSFCKFSNRTMGIQIREYIGDS